MSNIKQHFNQLSDDLAKLSSLLQQCQPQQALVSRIPPIIKGEEQVTVTEIIPEHVTGAQAMRVAAEAFSDIYLKPPFSQKSARRYVGVIHLHPEQPHCAEILALIAAINSHKAAIEHLVVTEHSTRQARFNAIHDNCPGVMTLQLYRKIHCFDNSGFDNSGFNDDAAGANALIKSVRFSWQRKDALHQPDKSQLIEQIKAEQQRAAPDYQLALQQLYQQVSTAPEAALRIRRPVKVQPVANIVSQSGLKTVTAPLPIIVVQAAPIVANAVNDFIATQVRKQRADKGKNTQLGCFIGHTIELKR